GVASGFMALTGSEGDQAAERPRRSSRRAAGAGGRHQYLVTATTQRTVAALIERGTKPCPPRDHWPRHIAVAGLGRTSGVPAPTPGGRELSPRAGGTTPFREIIKRTRGGRKRIRAAYVLSFFAPAAAPRWPRP